MNIKNRINEIYDEMILIRRDFHQHPELSNNEYKTQEKIMNLLNEYNIYNKISAKTGVLGLINGKNAGKTIALRADIDALPIHEINNLNFKSVNDNVMHACGHDVHMTILIGTAKILSELKNKLHGNVKLLFQPAEETTGGALPMIKDGVLENPTVDYAFGLHVMPYLEPGKIEIKHGQLNAASDEIYIKVQGKTGHGAYPEQGIDTILVTSHIITALQSIVSRNTSPLNSCVISIGSIHGGDKSNIICDKVVIKGTLRTLNAETRTFAKERIIKLANAQAESFAATCEVTFFEGYEALINDNEVVDYLNEVAIDTLGKENIVFKELPSLGVEDFSYFSNRVPGAFYHLGCKLKGTNLSLHHSNFDVDEECIKTGILMQVMLVLNKLNPNIK